MKYHKFIYLCQVKLTLLFLCLPISSFGESATLITLKKPDIQFSHNHPKTEAQTKVPKRYKKNIEDIVSGYSIFRRIESLLLKTDPRVYYSLLNDLPFANRLLNGLKINRFSLMQGKNKTLLFNDKKGMKAEIRPLFRNKETILYYGKGVYNGRIIKKLSGKILIIIHFEPNRKKNYIENDISFYMKFENRFMNTTVKILSYIFNPMLTKRITYYMSMVKTLCELIEDDPLLVYTSLQKQNKTTVDDLRRFKQIFLSHKPVNKK